MKQQQEVALLAAFQRMSDCDRRMIVDLARRCAQRATSKAHLQLVPTKASISETPETHPA